MATQIEEHRWTAPEGQFAVRIQVNDLEGFFSKKLVVEPGTRALVIDDGAYLGEVPPDTYTLESFGRRLRFWNKKQCTVVLVREEDFPISFLCGNLPTRENLSVEACVRLTVQIDDVGLFLKNLLGTRPEFSAEDLDGALAPLIRQALWEAVGRMSITELTAPEVRRDVDAAVDQALGVSLARYGLKFGQVQMASIKHEKFDEHRRKLGEAWLLKEGVEQQKALDDIYSAEELQKIKRQERTNELELLAENVGIDREEGQVAAALRRVGVRGRMREAVLSDKFDKIKTADELAAMLQEQDKSKLLRQEEIDELTAMYREKKEDREAARRHLVQHLELQRWYELAELRAEMDHRAKVRALDHEIQLARRVEDEDSRRWAAELEKQRQQADHNRQEQKKDLEHKCGLAAKMAGQKREDEWQTLLHQQRMDRLQGEVQIAQADRRSRIDVFEREMKERHAELDRRIKQGQFDDQLAKLERVQQLNADYVRRQAELAEMRADKSAQRELARLGAIKELGVEALVATADVANAEILAKMKMHESSQQTAQIEAQTGAAHLEASKQEQARMYERMLEQGKSHVDALAQAFREGMAGQQQIAQGGFAAMGPMGPAQANVGQPGGQTPSPGQPGTPAGKVLVCPKCRAENAETARFCAACGTQL